MAARDVKHGNKSRAPRSPMLSSFFRFHGLLPSFHRDTIPHHRHRSHHDRDGSQNKDRVKHPAKRRRQEQRSTDTIRIILQDVDHRHGPFYLVAKRDREVVKLETWVKERCQDSDRRPHDAVRVRFFADGRELGSHDLVGFQPSVWFRLVTPRDDDAWKFTYLDEGDEELTIRYADELTRAIESGNTVGQLRKLVASHRGIDDPDRVAVVARDGARVGSLQGDMWELRQVRSWFCRWLSFEVSPLDYYAVLVGPWGRYLFHPSEDCYAEGMLTAKDVKKMLETCLLPRLDRDCDSKLSIKRSQITLTSRGSRLADNAAIYPGAKVGLELPWHLEDGLSAEESWLLPATETCTVCADDKKPTELAVRIASGCKHESSTCRDCLGRWIHSSLDTSTWDRLKCPECPELLNFDSVRRYAVRQDFDRYDTLATRAALESVPNFRWCLSTSCESGQVHDPACTKFKCTACKAKHCVLHNVPWHSGESCEEYDRRNRRRRKDDKASEDMIKSTTKLCPECKQPVHKWTGCNHITCKSLPPLFGVPFPGLHILYTAFPLTQAQPGVCGHEWCYLCLAPFRRNLHGFLYCRHNPGCTEVDPFADDIDPAGARRGRPERAQPFHPRPPPLAQPAFMHRPVAAAAAAAPQVRRHEPVRDELAAWLDEMDEELVAVPDGPRALNDTPRPPFRRLRIDDLLEEEALNPAAIGFMDGGHRPEDHQHWHHDTADAWVRTWGRIEHAMLAEMARNLRMGN